MSSKTEEMAGLFNEDTACISGEVGFYEYETDTFYLKNELDVEKRYYGLCVAIRADSGRIWACLGGTPKSTIKRVLEVLNIRLQNT